MISKLEPHIVQVFPFKNRSIGFLQKMLAFFDEDLAVGRHGPGFRDAEGWSLAGKHGFHQGKNRKTLEMLIVD